MQLGEFGSAVNELSHILSQAIVVPFRRVDGRRWVRTAGQRQAPVRAGSRPRGHDGPVRGHLLLSAGGLPDDLVVELIHQVGGRKARVLVLPASTYAHAAGERYRRYFQRFGMEQAETLPLTTRQQAEEAAPAGRLAGADVLVIGGGHPDLLLDVLAGTAAGEALVSALVRGAAVVAIGPAAEAVGEWFLPGPEGAQGKGAALRRGLGLLPGTLVACGPQAAGRLAGLFGAALTERVQALVLDERSTLLVRGGWQADVRTGTVLAAGAPEEVQGAGRAPLGVVWTRVAPAGWRLDLAARAVLPPGTAAAGGSTAPDLPPSR